MIATVGVSDIKHKGRVRSRNRTPRGSSQLREVFDYLVGERLTFLGCLQANRMVSL
jgi:hypothetical protein